MCCGGDMYQYVDRVFCLRTPCSQLNKHHIFNTLEFRWVLFYFVIFSHFQARACVSHSVMHVCLFVTHTRFSCYETFFRHFFPSRFPHLSLIFT
jgi:hypothetical protein